MSSIGKQITGLDGLSPLGINVLTGEACRYNMRLLCDVSEKGKELLCRYFAVNSFDMQANQNTWVDEDYAIGSIMLSAATLWDIAAFALLAEGYDRVVPCQQEHHGVYGFNLATEAAYEYHTKLCAEGLRILRVFP